MGLKKLVSRLGFFLLAMAVLGYPLAVYGQSGSKNEGSSSKTKDQEALNVTVEGRQVVLTDEEDGSGSKDDPASQKYGIQVTRVVVEGGRELNELHGSVLQYLETRKNKKLIRKFQRGENLIVKGKLRTDNRQHWLEVTTIQLASPTDSEHHGSDSKL